jgi:hypothetical protein
MKARKRVSFPLGVAVAYAFYCLPHILAIAWREKRDKEGE